MDWQQLKVLADEQGLSAVVLEGINQLKEVCEKCSDRSAGREERTDGCTFPSKPLMLQWIGEVLRGEAVHGEQQKMAAKMAKLFHDNGIRTYVLKGMVIAECYPKASYRRSVDMDCFLVAAGDFDAWSLGNDLIRAKGFQVDDGFYKNSTFRLPGLMVENHLFLTPFRGNKRLTRLEKLLQSDIHEDKDFQTFEGTWLYKPPVMVSALFLIEHAYSHFLHEGLTWKMVLDWMMFCKRHKDDIRWKEFEGKMDEYGFRKFYDSFVRLGRYLIGEIGEGDLTKRDLKMQEDIWAPLDLHETLHGIKGKLALAGNTWRARWKYRYFTEMNWVMALLIQVKGFFFMKHPVLD